jgi:hypothetical protein
LTWGVWIGFDWLRTGTGGRLLWMLWWTFEFLRHVVSYRCVDETLTRDSVIDTTGCIRIECLKIFPVSLRSTHSGRNLHARNEDWWKFTWCSSHIPSLASPGPVWILATLGVTERVVWCVQCVA